MNIDRRGFFRLATHSAMGAGVAALIRADSYARSEGSASQQLSTREFLKSLLYTREEVDQWLAGKAFPFAKYSAEFGWLLPDAYFRDGVDDSISVYTYAQPDGERDCDQAETHQRSRLVECQIKEMSKIYLDIVSEIVERGQQEGSIRKDLYVGLVKRFILGAVDEVINTWLHSGPTYDLVSMADPLVDLFIRGIGCGFPSDNR